MFLSGIHHRVWLGLLVAALIAVILRCPSLAARPMHTDEAVNAIKLRAMMEQGSYRYDPDEHHGPVLYYAGFVWLKFLGVKEFPAVSETKLRSLTVLFGVALILLLPLIVDGLGRGATVGAALLTAVSPAMVFYSRYFIHEMLLVFFTFLALAAFWRHQRSGKIRWAICAGAAVGLMQSTKETFVLSLGAAGVAWLFNRHWTTSDRTPSVKPRATCKPVAVGLIAWCVVAVIFFSSFFANSAGLLDAVRTYLPWLNRAAGNSPHIHAWNFYLSRLAWFHVPNGPVWSEAFIILLAAIGIFVAFTGRGRADAKQNFLRLVAFYTLALTIVYSAIAYKTPWCLLSFWQGAILLAGAGLVALWRFAKNHWMKSAVGILLLLGAGHLAVQAWRLAGSYSADRRNPYVYAQTSPNIFELVSTINALSQASEPRSHLRINVSAPANDYWPLPWYLRTFDQVGWTNDLPAEAPVMIVATQFAARLEGDNAHQAAGMFELRPGVFLSLYVEPNLWRAYLNSQRSPAE